MDFEPRMVDEFDRHQGSLRAYEYSPPADTELGYVWEMIKTMAEHIDHLTARVAELEEAAKPSPWDELSSERFD